MPGAVKKVAAGDCGIHRRGWMHTLGESWRKAQEKIQLFRFLIQMKDVTDMKDTMFLYWNIFIVFQWQTTERTMSEWCKRIWSTQQSEKCVSGYRNWAELKWNQSQSFYWVNLTLIVKQMQKNKVCDYNHVNIQVIYNKTRKNKSGDRLWNRLFCNVFGFGGSGSHCLCGRCVWDSVHLAST